MAPWSCRLVSHTNRSPHQHPATQRAVPCFQVWKKSPAAAEILVQVYQCLASPTAVNMCSEVRPFRVLEEPQVLGWSCTSPRPCGLTEPLRPRNWYLFDAPLMKLSIMLPVSCRQGITPNHNRHKTTMEWLTISRIPTSLVSEFFSSLVKIITEVQQRITDFKNVHETRHVMVFSSIRGSACLWILMSGMQKCVLTFMAGGPAAVLPLHMFKRAPDFSSVLKLKKVLKSAFPFADLLNNNSEPNLSTLATISLTWPLNIQLLTNFGRMWIATPCQRRLSLQDVIAADAKG